MSLPAAEDIRRLRRAAGLTQRELAERAGVSQSLVARIEAGGVDPRLSTLRKIVAALVQRGQATASDIMHRPVVHVEPNDTVRRAVDLMVRHAISQLPVIDGGNVVGSIQEATLVRRILQSARPEEVFDGLVREVMEEPFPIVGPSTVASDLLSLLSRDQPAALVAEGGRVVGIVTKIDLVTAMAKRASAAT